jgi:hypothetical protein
MRFFLFQKGLLGLFSKGKTVLLYLLFFKKKKKGSKVLVVALFSIGNPTSSLWVNNDYWLAGWGFAPHDLVDSLYSESKVNFSPSAFLLPVYFQL